MEKKEFIVDITETLNRRIIVQAYSLDDAHRQIKDQYDAEDIVLDAEDFVGTEISIQPAEVDFNEFHDGIIAKLLAHKQGKLTLSDEDLAAYTKSARDTEDILDMEFRQKGETLPDVTKTYTMTFASHDLKYTYCVEADVSAKRNYLDHQFFVPTVEMVSQAVVRTTNLSTGEQRVFDYDRIKQAFDYYAGNVKGDIMEYFDWEYVRFLLLEELE